MINFISFFQMIASFVCIYLCVEFAQRWNKWKVNTLIMMMPGKKTFQLFCKNLSIFLYQTVNNVKLNFYHGIFSLNFDWILLTLDLYLFFRGHFYFRIFIFVDLKLSVNYNIWYKNKAYERTYDIQGNPQITDAFLFVTKSATK